MRVSGDFMPPLVKILSWWNIHRWVDSGYLGASDKFLSKTLQPCHSRGLIDDLLTICAKVELVKPYGIYD